MGGGPGGVAAGAPGGPGGAGGGRPGALEGRQLRRDAGGRGPAAARAVAAPGRGLEGLGDLWACEQLVTLNLAFNRVADLGALAGLGRLEALNLVHNRVESLEPLAGLGALRVLKVSHNQVDSLAPLRGLGALEELWVHHNRVADAGELAALGGAARLKHLWFSPNPCSRRRVGARAFRLGVLQRVPSLERLDTELVSEAEREESRTFVPEKAAPTNAPADAGTGRRAARAGTDSGARAAAGRVRSKGRGANPGVRAPQVENSSLPLKTGPGEEEASDGAGGAPRPPAASRHGHSASASGMSERYLARKRFVDSQKKIRAAEPPEDELPESITAAMELIPDFKTETLGKPPRPSPSKPARRKTPQVAVNSDPLSNLVEFQQQYANSTVNAVTVRRDGSAEGKWPGGDVAVQVESERSREHGQRYRLFATFHGSSRMAASFDPDGGGFVNYSSGKTFAVLGALGNGTVYSPEGDVLHSWDAGSLPGRAVEIQLDQYLGFRWRTPGGVPEVYMAIKGFKHRFIQGFNVPDSTWGGGEDGEPPEFASRLGGLQERGASPRKAQKASARAPGDMQSVNATLASLGADLDKMLKGMH